MSAPVAEPEKEEVAAGPVQPSSRGFWSSAWRQFRRDRVAVFALWIIAALFALAVFQPFLATGLPFRLAGVQTLFYTNQVAAFLDWHKQYRAVAKELGDPGKLSPSELAEKKAYARLYSDGLVAILGRLEDVLGPEDAKALAALGKEYAALLEVPPEKLALEDHERLGAEIDERFGAFAIEPAFNRAQAPLTTFEFDLLKPLLAAQQDLRDATEDSDDKAIAAAKSRLAALEPRAVELSARAELGAKALAAFLGDQDRAALEAVAAELAETMRAAAKPGAPEGVDKKFSRLSDRVSREFATKPVAPERQRLPFRVSHPVLDYLSGLQIGFMVLYVTAVLAVAFRGKFERLTALAPFDPSDLGAVRVAAIVAPAVVVGFVYGALVPRHEPPPDTLYKQFAEDGVARDPRSSITFAPVPFGENENLLQDKMSPPTWLEGLWHKTKRLRAEDEHPEGVPVADVVLWLEAREYSRPLPATTPRIEVWAQDLVAKRLTKLRYHWLGTDQGGRDVLARVIYGSRISLSVGFVSVAIYITIGIILGALAGFFRGWVDIVISRMTEIIMCIPSFFLIMAVMAVVDTQSIWNIMVVIGLTGWTGVMRLVRGEYLRLVSLDFVTAGRSLGLSSARVIFRHVLPNALAPVLVAATFGVAGAILTESALSYLGYGVPTPTASWGSVLNEASGGKEKALWWVTIFPGFLIFLTITAYNLVGEGFRDATDPRLRR